MDLHCVVTGQTKSGKSVIIRNTPVQPISLALLPGYEFHRLWGSDSIPELPCDGTALPHPREFPPTNGFRVRLFHYTAGCEDESRSDRHSRRARRNSTEVAVG